MMLHVSLGDPCIYYAQAPQCCALCEVQLSGQAMYSIRWGWSAPIYKQVNGEFELVSEPQQLPPEILLFCMHCIGQRWRLEHAMLRGRLFNAVGVASVVSVIPLDCRAFIPFPPEMVAGYLNSFEAADVRFSKKWATDTQGVHVVDRTRLAGRESFEGAQIGHVDRALLEAQDRSVRSVGEADRILLGLKLGADKAIAEEKKKQFDDKSRGETDGEA